MNVSFQFCKFMMESIIAKGSPVRDFKKQIIVEARHQGVDCEFHEDRCVSLRVTAFSVIVAHTHMHVAVARAS